MNDSAYVMELIRSSALRHPHEKAPSAFAQLPKSHVLTKLMAHFSATGILPEHPCASVDR